MKRRADGAVDEAEIRRLKVERRILRKKQREVYEQMMNDQEKMADIRATLFDIVQDKNDELFAKADRAREQLGDAVNLKEISRAAKLQAEKMDFSRRLDFDQFGRNLKACYSTAEGEGGAFDWARLGRDFGAAMTIAPEYSCLLGPLEVDIKQAKARKERARQEPRGPMETTQQLRQGEDEDAPGNCEATNVRVQRMAEFLKTKEDRSHSLSEPKPLVDCLVDTRSPVQTVENFFDSAFLVKNKGTVIMPAPAATPNLGPQMVIRDALQDGDSAAMAAAKAERDVPSRQLVLSMRMKELKQLADLFPEDHESPLHRTDDLYQVRSAVEQTRVIARRDSARTQPAERRQRSKGKPKAKRSAPAEDA